MQSHFPYNLKCYDSLFAVCVENEILLPYKEKLMKRKVFWTRTAYRSFNLSLFHLSAKYRRSAVGGPEWNLHGTRLASARLHGNSSEMPYSRKVLTWNRLVRYLISAFSAYMYVSLPEWSHSVLSHFHHVGRFIVSRRETRDSPYIVLFANTAGSKLSLGAPRERMQNREPRAWLHTLRWN